MVPLPARSPVICTSRMNVPPLITVAGLLHVEPPSVEKMLMRAPWPILKSFQEMYTRPKKGELGLLSAQPDSRSAEPSLKAQKCVQLFGSAGVVVLYPPRPLPPQAPSNQTVTQVPDGLWYRTTGSPKVLSKGLWPFALVRREKVVPPSVDTDAP